MADYLFSIAINRYSEWVPLRGPVPDQEAFCELMADLYGFHPERIIRLRDEEATKAAIIQKFRSFGRLKPDDRLVVSFSGHGHKDRTFDHMGYWIASNGSRDEDEASNWIPNAQLRNIFARLPVKNVLVISDSCFSGDLLDPSRDLQPRTPASLEMSERLMSREVLTSGSDEEVKDVGVGGHSPFMYHLLDALRREEEWTDPFRLYERLRTGVYDQLPLYGNLGQDSGHQKGGGFILRRGGRTAAAGMSPGPSKETSPFDRDFEIGGSGRMVDLIQSLEKRYEERSQKLLTEMEEFGKYERSPVAKPAVIREIWGGLCKQYGVTGEAYEYGIRLRMNAELEIEVARLPFIVERRDLNLRLAGEVDLHLKWINPGTFLMGSPKGELGRRDGEDQHKVKLTKGYWLGIYPVTQGQWQAVVGDNPSYFKKSGLNAPVESVCWEDAVAFCRKLTEMERAAGRLPEGYEYRLPTEAQWEYACRAGSQAALNSGKDLTSVTGTCSHLNEVGWYGENSGNQTHPVGEKQSNAWWLYDLHGNVFEWCQDWYGDYPKKPAIDPTGPAKGQHRVLRGGRWNLGARYCRSACRLNGTPSHRYGYCGFRLSLQVRSS